MIAADDLLTKRLRNSSLTFRGGMQAVGAEQVRIGVEDRIEIDDLSQFEFHGHLLDPPVQILDAGDGAEGRLVAIHSFSESWTSWEMHPAGDELVVCVAGEITLIQELPGGGTDGVTLRAGEYAVNPPGVWHTADVAGEATALFITAGVGTENRPR